MGYTGRVTNMKKLWPMLIWVTGSVLQTLFFIILGCTLQPFSGNAQVLHGYYDCTKNHLAFQAPELIFSFRRLAEAVVYNAWSTESVFRRHIFNTGWFFNNLTTIPLYCSPNPSEARHRTNHGMVHACDYCTNIKKSFWDLSLLQNDNTVNNQPYDIRQHQSPYLEMRAFSKLIYEH